ncbi:hypothetical protein L1049_018278 [Liquidambar formosana]|uniref:Legume lectin domain-containing protein n=1 Tax=Liquidambar formosana TaxID=63359 RepID=A0AAP0R9V0_LIQFO
MSEDSIVSSALEMRALGKGNDLTEVIVASPADAEVITQCSNSDISPSGRERLSSSFLSCFYILANLVIPYVPMSYPGTLSRVALISEALSSASLASVLVPVLANNPEYTDPPFETQIIIARRVLTTATISNGALQITPDSVGNFSLAHRSDRILLDRSFKLWDGNGRVASFNSSFLINIFRLNSSFSPGEGFAFLIAPDIDLPPGSDGQYLGLTNSTTDGNPTKHPIAIELDTFKQDFDPDDNHMGLDINSVRSNKTVSLSHLGIQIAPVETKNYTVWVQYDGRSKVLEVYMTEQGEGRPPTPVMSADLELLWV